MALPLSSDESTSCFGNTNLASVFETCVTHLLGRKYQNKYWVGITEIWYTFSFFRITAGQSNAGEGTCDIKYFNVSLSLYKKPHIYKHILCNWLLYSKFFFTWLLSTHVHFVLYADCSCFSNPMFKYPPWPINNSES